MKPFSSRCRQGLAPPRRRITATVGGGARESRWQTLRAHLPLTTSPPDPGTNSPRLHPGLTALLDPWPPASVGPTPRRQCSPDLYPRPTPDAAADDPPVESAIEFRAGRDLAWCVTVCSNIKGRRSTDAPIPPEAPARANADAHRPLANRQASAASTMRLSAPGEN